MNILQFTILATFVFLTTNAVAQQPAKPKQPSPPPRNEAPTFRKVLSVPAGSKDDFKHAVVGVSNELKSLFSRNYIVTGGKNVRSSGLHLWTLDAEQAKRTKVGDGTEFGFVPNSTLAYYVSWGDGVVFWDTRTHTRVGHAVPHELREDSTLDPGVSPGGEYMATRSKLDHLQFWDLRTRKPVSAEIEQEGMVVSMEFSADGKWFFSRTSKRTVKVWDPKTGKLVGGPFRLDTNPAYAPKSQQLATFENNKTSEAVWRSEAVIRSGKEWSEVKRIELAGHAREAHWIDGTHLLVVADNKQPGAKGPFSYGRKLLYVVPVEGDKPEIQTVFRQRWISVAAVAPDGKHFLTSTYETRCWKLGEKEPVWSLPGRHLVSFADKDWVLLTRGGAAVVYSLADGKERWRKEHVDIARVQGSTIWLLGETSVELWQMGD